MAFDLVLNATVLFGGYTTGGSCPALTECALGDTWEFLDGSWFNVTPTHPTASNTPSARWGASMTYDPAVEGLLLFGGITAAFNGFNSPGLNDTWEFVRGDWVLLCDGPSCRAPQDRWDAALTYSVEAGAPVLFGGESTFSGSTLVLNDTWTFLPQTNWTPAGTSVAPSGRFAAGFADDRQLDGVVLFGGIPANSETWLFRNSSWHPLSPSPASGKPSARGGVDLAPDPLNGSVTLFGGCSAIPCGGTGLNDTWVLAGTNWYNLSAKIGPAPPGRDLGGLVPTSNRGALLLFGGASGTLENDSWWIAHIEIEPVTASPWAVDVGLPTMLNVNVSGGYGPETLTWSGLPSGCISANTNELNCTDNATSAEVATVVVTATDPVGEMVESLPSYVQFDARPTVTLEATPLEGIAPLQVTFEATSAGGTGNVSLAWQFGDSGTGTGSNPNHTYLTSGMYTATVWANDSDLVSDSAHTTVSVHSRLMANASFSSPTIVVGHASMLVLQWTGGVPPYEVHPLAPLPNCTNQVVVGPPTQAFYSCAPNASGVYHVQVRINDSSGQARNVSANLTVAAPAGSVTAASTGLTSTQKFLLTLAGALVIAVVVGIYVFGRRRPPGLIPPAHPEGPMPTGNLYVPPEDVRR
ncbi:MAG: PKD domain-containing protein [Thermoplasmata archaeon]|nr:PKD domain-containing protein [Thermoplasmata archaeon]